MLVWALYPVFGLIAGILAGLLGVGGGIVVVPALVFIFSVQGLPAGHVMQMALGTSLGTIMFTSISSFRAHHRRGAVDWGIVKAIAPGILLGTFSGSYLAARLSTDVLKGFFGVFLLYVATQMLLDVRPKPSRELPGLPGLTGAGLIIGAVSSLAGIGGGTLTVPFMTWCNTPMRLAVGTAAAIGFPIALAGTAGYLVNGLGAANLPDYHLGFIYLPALAGVSAASVLTAPLGARLAHALPVSALKRFFAVFLYLVAGKMLWGLLA
ncbi:MAG: sulfite exporter TauE/SafE family protein [Desulfovibrionaceae bacterium]|nr:sulfite exporter TauE/SafE family protein [Desulfovibrionaceae bacterium]MBF0514287.1 sulfite exporter TauE/SafE family protein [Desulfovibrionaceae bacterium]